MTTTSRLPNFYNLSLAERANLLAAQTALPADALAALTSGTGLVPAQADHMVENAIGTFNLPLGIALNFCVNGRDVLVPMAIEEPSVVAGASFMAKLARASGGFFTSSTAPEMIGQMQILGVPDVQHARLRLLERKADILAQADQVDPIIAKHGGGARDLDVRVLHHASIGDYLVLHLIYDTRDAMGANAINTATERLTPLIESLSGGRVHLRILSNLADRRLARARATFRVADLAFANYTGEQVRDGILAAWAFAASDPYRAATHNKGIMNGIDAVVIATGNDWRAIEAGAHAYAARDGRYTSLSHWEKNAAGDLVGSLSLPMAVGIVGGATKVHPTAKAAVQLLGVKTATELAEIITAVGLAQNLAALRALATEGIQRGHMGLHARQVAVAAGATGDWVTRVADRMVAERNIRLDHAQAILAELTVEGA